MAVGGVVSRRPMARLFTAIEIPLELRLALVRLRSGIPGARWVDPDRCHLTLRFIGEVDGAIERDVISALGLLSAPGFSVTMQGLGQFGDKKPHTLWAGVAPNETLIRLAAKIDQTLQRIGLPPEGRRYTPHVTLARLRDAPRDRVAEFMGAHGLFRAPPFDVDHFTLFSSHLGHAGAVYAEEARYPLGEDRLPMGSVH